MIEFVNGKKYVSKEKDILTYIGEDSDENHVFKHDKLNTFLTFSYANCCSFKEYQMPNFKFDFYLHAEKWALGDINACKKNLTDEQLEENRYFCSELKLTVVYDNGKFYLKSVDDEDVVGIDGKMIQLG